MGYIWVKVLKEFNHKNTGFNVGDSVNVTTEFALPYLKSQHLRIIAKSDEEE